MGKHFWLFWAGWNTGFLTLDLVMGVTGGPGVYFALAAAHAALLALCVVWRGAWAR